MAVSPSLCPPTLPQRMLGEDVGSYQRSGDTKSNPPHVLGPLGVPSFLGADTEILCQKRAFRGPFSSAPAASGTSNTSWSVPNFTFISRVSAMNLTALRQRSCEVKEDGVVRDCETSSFPGRQGGKGSPIKGGVTVGETQNERLSQAST